MCEFAGKSLEPVLGALGLNLVWLKNLVEQARDDPGVSLVLRDARVRELRVGGGHDAEGDVAPDPVADAVVHNSPFQIVVIIGGEIYAIDESVSTRTRVPVSGLISKMTPREFCARQKRETVFLA